MENGRTLNGVNLEISSRIVESNFLDLIEEITLSGASMYIPLRLMCQFSLVFGGLKQKVYDQFRSDICQVMEAYQTYGAHHILTFQNLMKAGLLNPIDKNAKSSFSQISKGLKLINDYDSETIKTDVSYAYSGYAPISLRLIQTASGNLSDVADGRPNGLSWKGAEDIIQLLPGASFEKSVIPETKSFRATSKSSLIRITGFYSQNFSCLHWRYNFSGNFCVTANIMRPSQ